MNIQEMTVEQLKALAYDQLVLLQRTQDNLRIINAEIEQKLATPKEEKDDKAGNNKSN